MNFKKEYEKVFTDISAGDDFKKQLANEMNRQKNVRIFPVRTLGMLATVAALALVVGAGYIANVNSKIDGSGVGAEENPVVKESSPLPESAEALSDTDIDINKKVLAQGDGESNYSQFHIADAAWYGDADSDAKKLGKFVEIMSGEGVDTLYCSDDRTFSDDDIVSVNQAELIADRVEETVAISSDEAGSVQYYKAVLTDGKTIVFEIWDGSYIKISGMEAIYELCR